MKDFQQSDEGGIAKSQLTTLLWFLWIWCASKKSSSNTEVVQSIVGEKLLISQIDMIGYTSYSFYASLGATSGGGRIHSLYIVKGVFKSIEWKKK